LKARDELMRIYASSHSGRGFHDLNASKQSIAAVRFYIDQIHNPLKTNISEEDVDAAIVDGSNDLGCDFIHRDDNHVTIIQAKFRKSKAQENPQDISHFKSILKRFRQPDLRLNRNLLAIANEIDWTRDSFELVYLTFGRMDPASQARKLSASPADYPNDVHDLDNRCEWRFLDEEELNVQLRSARDFKKGISDIKISLNPEGARGQRGETSIVESRSGDYRSFAMVLNARQIIQSYESLGRDSLFSLNIRNYIGNTNTNRKIIETAKNDPEQFFIYNNGISCLATNVETFSDRIVVTGLQVINGAQTVKALVHVAGNIRRLGLNCWAKQAPNVLVRITEIPEGYGNTGRARDRITELQ